MTAREHDSADLSGRLESVRSRVKAVALRSNRKFDEITIIGISKTHPVALLRSALEAGITDLGENRVQEAEAKIEKLGRNAVRWHLVGHLQPNKVRKAVRLFQVIHSLDSVSLAQRLNRICAEENHEQLPVLIQVDLGGEQTKAGIAQNELPQLVQTVLGCSQLQLIGLMTLPPFFEDPERARPYFRRLRELRDELQTAGHFGASNGELSMGMTHDFEIAIEEGATMLRIGTAIFGERTKH
jgi:PLP dependent protein